MKSKLTLEINSKAINDTSRSLEGSGIMITPPIGESFWLFRVQLTDKNAIVGFPKFGVIGIGFQKEEDWNTNLPAGEPAAKIYDHISHNKGDHRITRGRAIEAINLVQDAALKVKVAEYKDRLKGELNDSEKLKVVCEFLRRTGSYEIAQAAGH